jgi:hypothetical protein
MEMPVDILNRRLGDIRDNGDIDFDNTMTAVDIDTELQDKFVFFPLEELSEIAEQVDTSRERLYLGQGVGHLNVPSGISVEDAWTLAENALALWWLRKRDTELEQELLAKRPRPGVYTGNGGTFTVIVTEDQRVIVPLIGGGTQDYTDIWDRTLHKSWKLNRINVATGAIEPSA